MASDRSIWESHWQEIAERILPRQADFINNYRTPGEKRTEKMFDATAALALTRYAAAKESMLTPRTQKWHGLKPMDEDLEDNLEVRRYLEETRDILFKLRYSPSANYASQSHECYIGSGAFGTSALFIDDMVGSGIRYKSIHLSEMFIAEDQYGRIDTVHRKFEFTARQAMRKWGDKLPEKIRNAAEKTPEQKFEFIHCVKPNLEINQARRDYRGMPWASYYVSIEGKQILSRGGYRAFPYAIDREVTAPRETYGRSPAMLVLPDIKMLNEMSKTTIRAAHKAVDPPLLLTEDGLLSPMSVIPGALNYGGVDERGNQLVHPLQTNARIDISLEMMNQRREVINDAFLVTLFQILVDNPQMTATEAMLRAQEKGALLAPTMGRSQSEFLGPQIERELDIASMAGKLPPMPEVLAQRGGEIRIEYDSPLSRAQRSEEGVSILRTMEAVTQMATVDPSVLDAYDIPGMARELGEINGVPAKLIRSLEQIAEIQDKRQQQIAMKEFVDAAKPTAEAAQALAQAEATAASAPRRAIA